MPLPVWRLRDLREGRIHVQGHQELPELPEDSGEQQQEFMIFAGPLLTSEELQAQQAHDLDDEVEFVSPRVPGRMQRGASTPPAEKSEGE